MGFSTASVFVLIGAAAGVMFADASDVNSSIRGIDFTQVIVVAIQAVLALATLYIGTLAKQSAVAAKEAKDISKETKTAVNHKIDEWKTSMTDAQFAQGLLKGRADLEAEQDKAKAQAATGAAEAMAAMDAKHAAEAAAIVPVPIEIKPKRKH